MMRMHAAGGVVYRLENHIIWLLLIRDRFGRWSLPKGGIDPGESSAQAALREICEETGIEGEIVANLGSTDYEFLSASGHKACKTVDYFLVRALCERITPAIGEICEARWVDAKRVFELEGYSNNLKIIERALERLGGRDT